MNHEQFKTIRNKDPQNPQVLFLDHGSDVSLGIFLGDKILSNIQKDTKVFSFQDFCIMAEEISHFVYLLWSKSNNKKISLLDLEIQGEIDKFLLAADFYPEKSVFDKLFNDFYIRHDLSHEDRQRYFKAHRLGKKLAHRWMSKRGKKQKKIDWLRLFYRQNPPNRISMIEQGLH